MPLFSITSLTRFVPDTRIPTVLVPATSISPLLTTVSCESALRFGVDATLMPTALLTPLLISIFPLFSIAYFSPAFAVSSSSAATAFDIIRISQVSSSRPPDRLTSSLPIRISPLLINEAPLTCTPVTVPSFLPIPFCPSSSLPPFSLVTREPPDAVTPVLAITSLSVGSLLTRLKASTAMVPRLV